MREEGVWRVDMVVDKGDEEGERPGLDQRELDLGRVLGLMLLPPVPLARPEVSIGIG